MSLGLLSFYYFRLIVISSRFHTHSQFAQAHSPGVVKFGAGRIKFVFIRYVAPAVLIFGSEASLRRKSLKITGALHR